MTLNEELMTGNLYADAMHRLSKLKMQQTPAHVNIMEQVFSFIEA